MSTPSTTVGTISRYGDDAPVFGLKTETTGYAQDFSIKTTNEKASVENEVGWTVTVGYWNTKYEGSITIIDQTGSTLPEGNIAVDAGLAFSIVFANVAECSAVVVYEVDRKPEQKQFEKHTYTFEAYAMIDSAGGY